MALWTVLALLFWPLAAPAAPQVLEKDLALILPAGGRERIAARPPIFQESWLTRVHQAFLQTSIGDAMMAESDRDDWRLVAIRIAPCQPLLPHLTARNDQLCAPEIRLVWQPIEQMLSGAAWTYYADDRAIHVLYDADETLLLPPAEAARHAALRQRAKDLNSAEILEFALLQRRLARALVAEAQSLRSLSDPQEYAGLGERPEFSDPAKRGPFLGNLERFLARHARPARLKELTAFSLPAGRQPPLLDEWVFLAFEPAAGGYDIRAKNITLTSRKDGRLLLDLGLSTRGLMRRDDPKVYDALEQIPDADVAEIGASVLLAAIESTAKKRAIADVNVTHVAHTTCASCHKLNDLAFDFHNLSYLENRPISISPRVLLDVRRELEWLARGP